MASTTAADVMIDVLMEWGVDTIFGLPGDGINGIIEALRKRREEINFVHVRHEEAAAFMACGYAKYTGKLGVCLATSGPGGIHLLNGLYDAKLDGKPVLAITGLHHHDLLATHAQQDVDLDKAFMDVAVYNTRIMGPMHVENVMHMACRAALAHRGVAHVTMPVDTQSLPLKKGITSSRNIPGHSSETFAMAAGMPGDADIRRAADVLNEGKKVMMLVGQGALKATDELIQVAEILGAPIAKALLGKAAVPDDSPYTTGQVGLLGTTASQKGLEECDTLLMVGTSFPYIEYYPKPGDARCVQIDLDPKRLGLRYPVEVGICGDSVQSLKALIPHLKKKEKRSFLEKAQKEMKKWAETMETRGTVDSKPLKPQVVAWELGKRLKNNAILSCDSGSIATWWARQIPVKRGQMHSVSGNLATMACGAAGFTLDDPKDCGRVLDEALNTPGPAVVDAVVDPHEPPLPPSISFSQAKEFAEALAKGTPYRGKIITTILADKVREMV